MTINLYAVMFRIEPPNELYPLPLRYELEVFSHDSLPEERIIDFNSPDEKLSKIGYKKISSNLEITNYVSKLISRYGGFLAMERDWFSLLVYPKEKIIQATNLMIGENFTYLKPE